LKMYTGDETKENDVKAGTAPLNAHAFEADDTEPYSESCWGSIISCCGWALGSCCTVGTCGLCADSPYGLYKTVNKGFRGIILRFGRVKEVVSEGLHMVNPISEDLRQVDIRTCVAQLHQQTVLTMDNLSINIDGVVYYTIFDLDKAIFGVQDIGRAVKELALIALRKVFGYKTLQFCLEHRDELAHEIQSSVAKDTEEWGVKINMIQITDIRIPAHIKNILSSAATAKREATAKIILAQADVKAAELMRTASDILSSDGAMQMRMLETYGKLANGRNTKVVFFCRQTSR